MVCGRLEGERCSEDRECAGVCVAADSRYHTSFFKKSNDKQVEEKGVKRCQAYGLNEDGFNFMVGYHMVAIIIVLLFLILMGCCTCSYCCCERRHRLQKERSSRPVEKENDVEKV